MTMKNLPLLILLLLSACSSPEEMVEDAQAECSIIGYNINKERVPTLQCTERGYREIKSSQINPVQSVLIGVAVAAAASNVR